LRLDLTPPDDDGNGGGNGVPEPGTLTLAALGSPV